MGVDRLRALERGMWTASTRGDPEWMDLHLASDFVEYGRSGGVYRRSQILETAVGAFSARLSTIDVSQLCDDVALLTYRSAVETAADIEFANRTSIWVNDGSRWLLRFHQGTPSADWR